MHRFFGFGIDATPEKVCASRRKPRPTKLYKKLTTLIIDGVSMLRADLLDCVDTFLRKHGPRRGALFGDAPASSRSSPSFGLPGAQVRPPPVELGFRRSHKPRWLSGRRAQHVRRLVYPSGAPTGYASDRARHVREGDVVDTTEAELVVSVAGALCTFLVKRDDDSV